MLGSSALFAFQIGERDADGEPTADARLGALMQWEFQGAMLNLLELLGNFCKAWVKSKGG